MSLPIDVPATMPDQSADDQYIVEQLVGYKREAEQNRKGGLNPRDDKWEENLDLYWNRVDFSDKADWQSKVSMPEVPGFVDRFAAAIKDAMVNTPNGFYTVTDPYDTNSDLMPSIKKMEDVWLSVSGRNQIGQLLDFSAVFEEQVKMGALMNMAAVVRWSDDVKYGRVSVETVDPRQVWLDHTNRSLYRVRQTEVDLVDLVRMGSTLSSKGKPIYDTGEINRLMGDRISLQQKARELTGNDEQIMSDRKPIILDEYVATVLSPTGKIIMDNEVAIVADDKYLIRGPERNPFWHGKDWLVYSPLMTVPLSPYGRSYMEDFGSIAKVFNDLTNLLLDAAYMSGMKAFAMVPAMLQNPEQANTGIYPNKIFFLEEGYSAEDFAKALDLGSLDAGAVQIWQAIKKELSDAAGMNDISMGQLPDKTHIAASAVAGAQQSASSMLRSVASTIETRFLDPMLDLIWKTGLQHADRNDSRMATAVGADMYGALIGARRELISRPITFQARGISSLIQKQQKLTALMGVLQIIASNPNLAAAFIQRVDMDKFLALLFNLTNVDMAQLTLSDRQQAINAITQPLQDAANQQQGAPSPAAVKQMGGIAQSMGVAKQ